MALSMSEMEKRVADLSERVVQLQEALHAHLVENTAAKKVAKSAPKKAE